ncbi:DUF2156 domain-containing protein [Streptomyces sp. DASNCL29]|uniref:DUF2156 domain-containing protein n=1 Tax=Streptomyces sp. DASNCL29 TaxID=2583819 RepID=UPI00110FAE67|nr:DUF2156 domain-containing protein [Streptomyces sp. DASNCL29]TMU98602.1 DUF2156 domain-containing protein [Streptomyces sp. DASNCL29]
MDESPTTHDYLLHAVQTYTVADNPSAFLALNTGNSAFTAPGVEGVVVHRRAGRYVVQFGGPFAPADAYDDLLDLFQAYARERGLRWVGVQLQRSDAEAHARRGLTVNQIGASWAIELENFTLRGTRFMQLRNKISRAMRNGLRVEEVDAENWYDALRAIDRPWLNSKGDGSRPLEFLVGEYGGPAQKHRRLFMGFIGDQPVGYISYSPVFGSRAGWMHDLSRRVPGGSPGIMEAINAHAVDVFRGEGADWLHFGFTPFTGLAPVNELPGHSMAFRWFMQYLWAEGAAVYPAQTQLAYKEKWAPTTAIPEYVAFDGPASLAGFAHIFRACNAF